MDSSLKTLGLITSGPAAFEMLRAGRSFRAPYSVTRKSGMPFSFLLKTFVRYSQRAESCIGIWCEKTE